ncbi:hypothetical protein C7476_102368 [Phyllobacterium bourgognense]|uniref:Uncharacterized protein n=1 Tax=Phyllobacterium bourgognense TaxID=314236 RepID=A0A368Z3N3_9HYPH|nr:hypothetical protein C7476_102368 [Phyllobacterium bourgognense]
MCAVRLAHHEGGELIAGSNEMETLAIGMEIHQPPSW